MADAAVADAAAARRLRILADDLTGALDSAAAFAAPDVPIPVMWRLERGLPPVAAVDAATRELDLAPAVARHRALAPWLLGGAPAFRKIDSLMRGHWAAELAGLVAAAPGWRVVVAPAFPFQGRVTRGGRQWRVDPQEPLGEPIAATLRQALRKAGATPEALSVHDAETDADLDAVVRREAWGGARVLWVGTGGLAAALARVLPGMATGAGAPATEGPRLNLSAPAALGTPPAPPLPPPLQPPLPLLALIGSHHPVTTAQIDRAAAPDPGRHIWLGADRAGAEAVRQRLDRGLSAIVTVAFEGARAEAAAAIAARFAQLLDACPCPASLFVAGGETLRDVAAALGAESLAVQGALEPGLPVSRLRGGRLDGVPVVSKSGAFGPPDLLRRLIEPPQHADEIDIAR